MSEFRSEVRFLLGQEERRIECHDPHMTVLDYLRLQERMSGTKEGCAEGDCGACTVVVAELNGEGGLAYQAVNACIQFVPTLDGKQVLTVEHLCESGALHEVQDKLARAHGSQCGFCTPGFVMSPYALYQSGGSADQTELSDALAGNLCRCTGYGPILDAAEEMGGRDDLELSEGELAVVQALEAMQREKPLGFVSSKGSFFAPRSSDELASLYDQYPDATLLGGGTDLGLHVTKLKKRFGTIIYLGAVDDMRQIVETDDGLTVGGNVTYSEAMASLVANYSGMERVLRRIGARQVRNVGTIGGNIANGSPIGDMPPMLIALGAKLVLRKDEVRREINLQDFFIEYGKQDRAPDEFVEAITVPRLVSGERFAAYKISKRFDQDISAVLGAFKVKLVGGKVDEISIAFGGMAGVPQRAAHCEAVLKGKDWSDANVEKACAAMAIDFTPMNDLRASDQYRMTVAQNLLRRFHLEERSGVSLSLDAVEAAE